MKNIDRAVSSLKRLKLTQDANLCFNEQIGVLGLTLLLNLMDGNPKVQVPYIKKSIMDDVILSGRWGTAKNRIYQVSGLAQADEKSIRGILKYVDTVIGHHGIEGIMSNDRKHQEKTIQQMSDRVFTQVFVETLKKLELVHLLYLDNMRDGTPVVQIDLLRGNDVTTSITIDGFTGKISINDIFNNDIFVAPKQLQQIILNETKYVV